MSVQPIHVLILNRLRGRRHDLKFYQSQNLSDIELEVIKFRERDIIDDIRAKYHSVPCKLVSEEQGFWSSYHRYIEGQMSDLQLLKTLPFDVVYESRDELENIVKYFVDGGTGFYLIDGMITLGSISGPM